MRYYVFEPHPDGTGQPFINTEVIGPPPDGDDEDKRRHYALEFAQGSDEAEILTREELLEREDGQQALAAWEARDDSAADAEYAAMMAASHRFELEVAAMYGDHEAIEELKTNTARIYGGHATLLERIREDHRKEAS